MKLLAFAATNSSQSINRQLIGHATRILEEDAGYDVTASLSIPSFHDNFDVTAGTLTNPELDTELRAVLTALSNQSNTNQSSRIAETIS